MAQLEYVGFWKRVVAKPLIDGAILTIVCGVINGLSSWITGAGVIGWFYSHHNVGLYLTWILWPSAIEVLLVVRFGGTPGKLILGIRVVDDSGKYLSVPRSILRVLPDLSLTVASIGGFLTVMRHVPLFDAPPTFKEQGELLKDFLPGIYLALGDFAFLVSIVDVLFIPFTRNRRALHDYLAKSYVVTVRSLRAALSEEPTRLPDLAGQDASVGISVERPGESL